MKFFLPNNTHHQTLSIPNFYIDPKIYYLLSSISFIDYSSEYLRNIPARSLDSLRLEPEDAVQIITVHSIRGVLILMHVFGADFSGARNPSKGIYYAQGLLKGSTLHIERVVHGDDLLDQ